MKLKSAFVWLAAAVVGLSLGQAQAAILVVDDFTSTGTPPPSGNQWGQTGQAVMGTTRNMTKVGSLQAWKTPSSSPAPSPAVPAGTLRLQSNGQNSVAANQFLFMYNGSSASNTPTFTPKVNATGMNYLNVSGDFAIQSNTSVIARLTSGNGTVASVTVSGGTYDVNDKLWRFKISDFSPAMNMSQLQRVALEFRALGAVNNIDRIFFSTNLVPEPSTFALAGLAAVGLVIARRKKK